MAYQDIRIRRHAYRDTRCGYIGALSLETGVVDAMTADGAYANNLEYGLGGFLLIMITFLFVDIFDTAGTLYSVGRQAGYVDENDELMNSDEAFMSDVTATVVGALVGTSTTTTYIESGKRNRRGRQDRTGRRHGRSTDAIGSVLRGHLRIHTTVRNGISPCRRGCNDDAPKARDIDWGNQDVALPAFATMVLMPFTYSIAVGIAWGVILYTAIKAGQQKFDEISPVMGVLTILLILYYIGPGAQTGFEWLINDILSL